MPREDAVAGRLRATYPADRWALVRHVASEPGARSAGVRVVDLIAVGLWPSMGPRVELVEVKVTADDFRRETPEKSAPFLRYVSARWFAVPPEIVRTVRPLLPEGRGLLSVGTEHPTVIVQAPALEPVDRLSPFELALLRAAVSGSSAPTAPGLSKIMPRRVRQPERAAATLLDVALSAIEEASVEQLDALERALAARRAA